MRKFFLLCLFLLTSINAFSTETVVLNQDNTIILDLQFNTESTNSVLSKAYKLVNPSLRKMLNQTKSKKDIYLVIISPGGSIVAGLDLADSLNSLPVNIHTITVFGASMGFITAQLLGNRYITEHGVMMSHKASGGFGPGEFPGQLDQRYNFWKKRILKIDERIVSRTNGVHTLDTYHKLMENEYWCEGIDCVLNGFADNIVNVQCDATLSGNFEKTISLYFMGNNINIRVSRSKCPLIQGYKIMQAYVNGHIYDYSNEYINKFIKDNINNINNDLKK